MTTHKKGRAGRPLGAVSATSHGSIAAAVLRQSGRAMSTAEIVAAMKAEGVALSDLRFEAVNSVCTALRRRARAPGDIRRANPGRHQPALWEWVAPLSRAGPLSRAEVMVERMVDLVMAHDARRLSRRDFIEGVCEWSRDYEALDPAEQAEVRGLVRSRCREERARIKSANMSAAAKARWAAHRLKGKP
jgi:hypothetical protein